MPIFLKLLPPTTVCMHASARVSASEATIK